MIGATKAAIAVSSDTGSDLKFTGSKRLAFAFTCVQFTLDDEGTILQMLPDDVSRMAKAFEAERFEAGVVTARARRVILLSAKPAMIEMD